MPAFWTRPLAIGADDPNGRPRNTRQRRNGRWFWEPPPGRRGQYKAQALGADQASAWAHARKLNREMSGIDPDAPLVGTVAWLFEQFFVGERFLQLATSTQKDYRWLGKRLSAMPAGNTTLGQLQARVIRPRHCDGIYLAMQKASGHTTAHYACRFARRVWKWGGRREMVDQHPNPWAGMELAGVPQRHQRWEASLIPVFVAKAREMGRLSIGLAVMWAYSLGHRQGDVLSLTTAALAAKSRITSKTKAEVPLAVEAYPDLGLLLEEFADWKGGQKIDSDHVLVCETTKAPWQPDFFRHEFRRVADAAGIPKDIQFRDLRATAVTELADGGADMIELSTHSGHKTAQMARRYARPTMAQANSAAAKRHAAKLPKGGG